jgi:hypothetical protein
MDFKTATDRLTHDTTLTLGAVAKEFGIALGSLSRMRSGTSDTNRLQPPDRWERVIAKLARRESKKLTKRSAELERLAQELSAP